MKIPDTIKIGGFTYDIKRTDGPFVSNAGSALDGEHDFAKKIITVSGNGCAEYQELVFLHEVCHGIIENYASTERQDEGFVEAFSKGLYQVAVDNPEVFNRDGDTHCRYCEPKPDGVVYVMNDPEYSGIELSMHHAGELRVRYSEEGSDTYEAQEIIQMNYCPMCGRRLNTGSIRNAH